MNRAYGAVFHYWAQFSSARAVDGLWITWKKWSDFLRGFGLAETLTGGAAVLVCGDVGCQPD